MRTSTLVLTAKTYFKIIPWENKWPIFRAIMPHWCTLMFDIVTLD